MKREELEKLLNAIIAQKKKLLIIPGVTAVKPRRERATGTITLEVFVTEKEEGIERTIERETPNFQVRVPQSPRNHFSKTKRHKKRWRK